MDPIIYFVPSSLGELTISVAQYQDIHTVRAFIAEAGSWLRARGINQWSPGKPSEGYLNWLIERQLIYMVRKDEEPIATVTLKTSDIEIWGQDDGDALYLHLLVVSREYAGNGIGYLLLHWAAGRVKAMRKNYLRLDCWAENHALCAYYEKAGFSAKGQIELKNGWWSALYEKHVGLE